MGADVGEQSIGCIYEGTGQIKAGGKRQSAMNRFDKVLAQKAIVAVHRSDESTGMGVLVDGDFILTAAHCLPRIPDSDDPFGDIVRVDFEAVGSADAGIALVTRTDPCAGLATLADSTARGQALRGDDAMKYRHVTVERMPAELGRADDSPGEPWPVCIYTHFSEWIRGRVGLAVSRMVVE